MIWELDMALGFALIAFAIENNPIAPVTRTSPGYIRQEIERLLGERGSDALVAREPSTINHS